MESSVEPPIYVSCICKNCGNKWESEEFSKGCPKCFSININQAEMIRGL